MMVLGAQRGHDTIPPFCQPVHWDSPFPPTRATLHLTLSANAQKKKKKKNPFPSQILPDFRETKNTTKMGSLRRALITVDRLMRSTPTSLARAEPPIRHGSGYGFVGVYRFSTENHSNIHFDLSNEESKRRLYNRLIYRSKQRGFLELDLVLGKWVEEHIHSMDENGIKALSFVLDLENPDLWKWLTGQEQPPEAVKTNPVFTAVCNKVMNNLNAYASPETRAMPGEPWVRGWDDFRRGRDSPVKGNQ